VREETMPTPPAVLILDDGELDDVQALLQECEIPFARIRGGAIVRGGPPPRDLLIATPRHIDAVGEVIGDSINPPVRVMVVNEDSNALREQLRRNGFDYLVRRPVHNEALRLMLLHCVYKGEERRSDPRVAVGFEVTFRTGMLTRRATLVDLSIRGCRLQTRHRVEKGKRIKVLIPEALEAGEPITVLGQVMRLEGEKNEGEDLYRLGIQFEVADRDTLLALQNLIEDLSRGPAMLRVGADQVPRPTEPSAPDVRGVGRVAAKPTSRDAAPAKPEARETPPRSDAPGDAAARAERRRAKRARYSQTVPAFGDRALRVLVGRDLSVGGMRVQRESGLEIGRRLHLAIYGEAGEEPLLIWGTVDRDDGDEGLFVLFDAIDREAGQRLERMVVDLPTVESLHDSEAQAMGTVLSEIVDAANPSGSLPA
jgi:hypothetical protein